MRVAVSHVFAPPRHWPAAITVSSGCSGGTIGARIGLTDRTGAGTTGAGTTGGLPAAGSPAAFAGGCAGCSGGSGVCLALQLSASGGGMTSRGEGARSNTSSERSGAGSAGSDGATAGGGEAAHPQTTQMALIPRRPRIRSLYGATPRVRHPREDPKTAPSECRTIRRMGRSALILAALSLATGCGERQPEPVLAASSAADIFDSRAPPLEAGSTPLRIHRVDAAPEDLAEPVGEMVVMGHEAPRRISPDDRGPLVPAACPPSAAGDSVFSVECSGQQDGPPFNRGAAASALGTVVVSDCAQKNGPTGSGHVKIMFSPAGKVAASDVDSPPFAGTDVGKCVAKKFARIHIPPFVGGSVVVGKSFRVSR